jgi:predicted ArsR family transcriptional regulator
VSALDPAGALDAASRRHLLEILRSTGRPMAVSTLAAACGLHVNTVRAHLDVLRRAGLVARESEQAARRGRPRAMYTAVTRPARSGYEQLAAMLAAGWGADGAARAERAGYTAALDGDAAGGGTAGALDELVATFAEMGFDPQLDRDRDGGRIALRACPFRAVAAEHPDVVCALHLGLIRGVLTRHGAGDSASSLEPFLEPGLCVASVRSAQA